MFLRKIHILFVFIATLLFAVTSNIVTAKSDMEKEEITALDRGKIAKFSLSKSITIYNCTNGQDAALFCKSISRLLDYKGVTEYSIDKNSGSHTIEVGIAEYIEGIEKGEKDGYSIEVTKNKVEIKYLSLRSMGWARKELERRIVEKGGLLGKKQYIEGGYFCATTGEDGSEIIIDLTERTFKVNEIRSRITNASINHKNIIFIRLFSNNGYGVKSPLMDEMNPTIEFAEGKLTYSELNDVFNYSDENGVDLIALFDFNIEKSDYFEEYFGHKLFSVEGLRFSRAFLKEFLTSCNYKILCFGGGSPSKLYQKKYIAPLSRVARKFNCEVVTDRKEDE